MTKNRLEVKENGSTNDRRKSSIRKIRQKEGDLSTAPGYGMFLIVVSFQMENEPMKAMSHQIKRGEKKKSMKESQPKFYLRIICGILNRGHE